MREIKSKEVEETIDLNKDENIDINLFKNMNEPINENINKQEDIPLNIKLDSSITISNTHSINIPQCEGYGSNWPSILAIDFNIPEIKIQNENFFSGIELVINANDQGWGGTGHNNVRYQINNNKPVVGFFIDIEKNITNVYKLIIPPSQIKSNDNLKLWLSCAPWGSWKASMTNIKGTIKFN